MARHLLDGGKITDGMEIPSVGKIALNGNITVVDAMIDITADNVDSFGF
jgi:hypothetical protein